MRYKCSRCGFLDSRIFVTIAGLFAAGLLTRSVAAMVMGGSVAPDRVVGALVGLGILIWVVLAWRDAD